VGINHVALEVEDVDAALDFYGRLFAFELRGQIGSRMAFIDIGDQFVALASGRSQPPDQRRHFGLVVDDRDAVRGALAETDAQVLPGAGVDFIDPWGNHVQVVQYDEIQFTKAPAVLGGMGLSGMTKTPAAQRELRDKGLDG
jgi:catechol 2,3-dioxygenase-like lactoylglutathione lyase family enzyme